MQLLGIHFDILQSLRMRFLSSSRQLRGIILDTGPFIFSNTFLFMITL